MSYDVHLEIDTGNGMAVVWDGPNYTYNMSYAITHGGILMYRLREGETTDLFVLDGALASAAADSLTAAIAAIERDAAELREREPSNGWGSVDRLLEVFLRPILAACREHPKATVRVT